MIGGWDRLVEKGERKKVKVIGRFSINLSRGRLQQTVLSSIKSKP